jgi:thioredoxin reductase (NADPH)
MTASNSKEGEHQLRLLGTHGSSAAYALRDFLYRSGVPFEWVELTTDEQARELAQVSDLQDGRLPVCFFPDGTRQECPTIRQIAEKLGWFRRPSSAEYDLVILGARERANHFGAEILLLREGVRTELLPGKAIGHLADGTSFVCTPRSAPPVWSIAA